MEKLRVDEKLKGIYEDPLARDMINKVIDWVLTLEAKIERLNNEIIILKTENKNDVTLEK